jgi:glycosyltransferase involved in cell wall biosynthesis
VGCEAVLSFGPVDLLYFYRVPVPDPRADAIQILNTCAGVVRAGGSVSLHVETMSSPTVTECLGFYGIDLAAEDDLRRLSIHPLGRHWSWPLFGPRIRRALRRAEGRSACVFVREVRPYVPVLIARAKTAGLPVIFEAHNVSTDLVLEKAVATRSPGGAGSSTERETPACAAGGEGPGPAGAGVARRSALEASILASADALVCTQKATLEKLAPRLGPGAPTIVLGNAAQRPPRDLVFDGPKDIDVLYCGSLKSWKGVDGLVQAMGLLGPYRLLVVGPQSPPDLERLQRAARAAGAADRVSFLPPVPPSEVWRLYARARVGVIPLRGEGSIEAREFTSPLKLFEMMAAGLPVVASDLGSLREYVRSGRDAMLVPPDDPAALADGIRKVLSDGVFAGGLAVSARARAADLTWDARGARLLAFAEDLARQPRFSRVPR